jgi:hypothetical protein
MSFSATEAAFEGFRVVRRKPVVVLFWSAVYLAMFAVTFAVGASSLARIMAMAETLQSSEPSMADVEALGASYGGFLAWVAPLGLAAGAILSAAIARAVLRPEQSAWGYLRFGKDELRVLVVSVAIGLIFGVLGGAGFAIVSLLFASGAASGQAILFLVALLASLAVIAGLVWLGVRLSLAVPMTLDRGRIVVFESFKATKGRFWPMLGMALIVVIMAFVVSLLGGIVAMPVTLVSGGLESLAALDGAPLGEILARAWPALAAWSVVNAILSALQLAVLYAPFSAVWRDIRGTGAI